MGDSLDRAFSASLRRGLSEELRELADFGLGGSDAQTSDFMQIESQSAAGVEDPATPATSLAAQSWPLNHGGGDNSNLFADSQWIPSHFSAGPPETLPAASAADFAPEGGLPRRQMPVVITTYQGRRASWDAADGAASWQAQQQQQYGSFARASGGALDGGGGSGGGPTSSESPRGADADERRRMRRRTLNRESAKRARNRQRTQLEEAQAQVLALGSENARLQEAVKTAEAQRDAATRALDAARAQLGTLGAGAAPRDPKAAAPRSGAASPALARLSGGRSSAVGSSAGSGASEQSSTRLGSTFQLPPRAPEAPAAAHDAKPYDARAPLEQGSFPLATPAALAVANPRGSEPQQARDDDLKPFGGGGGWGSMMMMPPPPPAAQQQQPAIPRLGRSPPRQTTSRHRQQRPRSPPAAQGHHRSASAPSPAMPNVQMQWPQPLTTKAASQPTPALSMGGQPRYVVSTGIPTPAPPAPPPPRFQVPPQQLQQEQRSSSLATAASGSMTPSTRSRRSGLRGSSPAESPFSDMSDTPFHD